MAAPLLSDAELRFLGALLDKNIRFMLVGLSAAALQGAPVVTQDVDLWFEDLGDPGIRQALREVGGAYVPPSISNPPMFVGGGTELFDIVLTMDGMGPFEDESARSVAVSVGAFEVSVLPLDRILTSKRPANRPKDRLVIPVLEDALRASETTERRNGEAGGTD